MKSILLTLTFFVYPAVINASETENTEVKDVEYFIHASRLEKIQADAMVETMVKSGRITKDHGDRAKREIASIHEENLEELKKEAIVHIKSRDLANK